MQAMNPIPADLLTGWDIVIVDDEDDSLEVARYILDFYGAKVQTGVNGKEGLELVRAAHPKFVISDLSMPVMDGWEFLRNLKADPATQNIPVIALTAHAMVGDRERAVSAGFHSYLTKPLTAETFMNELVTLLMAIPALSEALNI
jgi:CheY-like chemotaxis protein